MKRIKHNNIYKLRTSLKTKKNVKNISKAGLSVNIYKDVYIKEKKKWSDFYNFSFFSYDTNCFLILLPENKKINKKRNRNNDKRRPFLNQHNIYKTDTDIDR